MKGLLHMLQVLLAKRTLAYEALKLRIPKTQVTQPRELQPIDFLRLIEEYIIFFDSPPPHPTPSIKPRALQPTEP